MMPCCTICNWDLGEPVYVSTNHDSLTTMLSPCEGTTEVFFCDSCGHLQTKPLLNIREFYEQTYAILADSDEEDQLYKTMNGRQVFQTEHRVNTLLEKVQIPPNGTFLDLGCAKGLVLSEVSRRRPDVTPFFYEVSERYVRYWRNRANADQWAVGQAPPDWQGRFDLVTSFYVLEHVDQPVQAICQQVRLLREGGILYLLVPNVYANTADLVVADHLQHYSETSLVHLLERSGLEVIDIDDSVHESAFVAVARKVAKPRPYRTTKKEVADLSHEVCAMSRFWSELSGRIRAFERLNSEGDRACIYGAGFYGNFIASCLENRDHIECFVDQNPYLHRKPMHGRPVVAPNEVDSRITKMYVGLNPARARDIIRGIESWRDRQFDCFYV
jgi:SAM-dependent methyltransferase